MNINPYFSSLHLNKFGGKYFLDNQYIFLPFQKADENGTQQYATKMHELIHFYQCLTTPFGLYLSLLYTLRTIFIKNDLKNTSKFMTHKIILPIKQLITEWLFNKVPVVDMFHKIRILDSAISAFNPFFLKKGKFVLEYDKLQKTYSYFFPFQKYLISEPNRQYLFPCPQAYTDNYSILEGQALYWEIYFRSNKKNYSVLNQLLRDEIKEISKNDVNYFYQGSSIYSRSFEIADEYLHDETLPFYSFMCELSLFGELPHIKGWPPIPEYGRCGKGGTIPFEKVNPGCRFEDIFFFFQNKIYLNKYLSFFYDQDEIKLHDVVDEICSFYKWKLPYNIIIEEINMIDILLDTILSDSEKVQHDYIELIDLLKMAKKCMLIRKNKPFLLSFPKKLPDKPKPIIFYIDGPDFHPQDAVYKNSIEKLIDSSLCNIFYPYFEHSEKDFNEMQKDYICPGKIEPALSFLCEQISCNDRYADCMIGKNFIENWGVNKDIITLMR